MLVELVFGGFDNGLFILLTNATGGLGAVTTVRRDFKDHGAVPDRSWGYNTEHLTQSGVQRYQ